MIVASAEGRVTTPDRKMLPGSALTLDRAVIHACRYGGLSFEAAWAMASTQPAALLHLDPPPVTVRVGADGFVATRR